MTKLPERTAGFATGLCALAVVVDGLLAGRTALLVCSVLQPLVCLALFVSVLVFVRLRLSRLVDEERQDESVARSENAGALFKADGDATEAFTLARSRDQFERFFVPAVSLLIATGLALAVWRCWKTLPWDHAQPHDHLMACAFLLGQAFFFFLSSRYMLGFSRNADYRLIRGPALFTGLVAFASLLGAASSVAAYSVWAAADVVAAKAILIVLALLAAENVVRFVTALYSPRRRTAFGTAYESRFAALCADPAAWTRDLAQALDYQFGFKVSETGLFRVAQRALIPLVIFQIVILYAMSSFVFLGPDEEAILERLGRPAPGAWHLSSGFHFKWPWPFETVRRFPAKRILTTQLGYQSEPGAAKPAVLLWTIPHFRAEENFIVPSRSQGAGDNSAVPVNLVSLNIPIEYRITNVYAFAYNFADPETVLRQAAYRALTREITGLDLFALLGEDRREAGERLKSAIQRDANTLGIGVQIEFVALQGVHPPVAVAPAFESVVGSMEEREASILTANAYAHSVMPVAEANADKAQREAEAYRTGRTLNAEADAEQFEKRLGAYRKSPDVFKSRLYLGTLRDALAHTRKYIVDAPPSREVIYLNLEEKPFQGLFDLAPTSPGAKP